MMIRIHYQLPVILMIAVSLIHFGCEKDPEGEKLRLPELSTASVEEISANSAVSGGSVTSDGGLEITDKGICWSSVSNPDLNDEVISAGSGAGTFICTIEGLQSATSYYIRAYATNSDGTGYGEEVAFQTVDTTIIKDIDGNGYETVVIGDQVWMAQNLRVTKFRSGAAISQITNNDLWSNATSPAYCWLENEEGNQYGILYNGYVITTDEVCPDGWHVPTTGDWEMLIETVGGEDVAGGKLKESGTLHWSDPNTGASDEFGFTALPGGLRYVDGTFRNREERGYWWVDPDGIPENWYGMSMGYNEASAGVGGTSTNFGFSVRCLKD